MYLRFYSPISMLVLTLLCSHSSADNQIRTVALSGTQAVGAPVGINYSVFLGPVLNNEGQVAFSATVNLPGGRFGEWSEGGSNGLRLIAKIGDVAPGTSTTFTGFTDQHLGDSGRVVFTAQLPGGRGCTDCTGIWTESVDDGLQLLARGGSPAPGTGRNFTFVFAESINDSGLVALSGNSGFDTVQDGSGVWSGYETSDLRLVAHTDQQAPGLPDVKFANITQPITRVDDSGKIAFAAVLKGPTVTPDTNDSVWSEAGTNGLRLIVQGGDQGPGYAAGTVFTGFGLVELNDSGRTAFLGELHGSDVTLENAVGVWIETPGTGLQQILRIEDAIGQPGDELYVGAVNQIRRTGSGGFAIGVNLTGSGVDPMNPLAILLYDPIGGLRIAAGGSGATSETPPNNTSVDGYQRWSVNDEGRVAYSGNLAGLGVDSTNDEGIWAQDQNGALRLLLREGDQIDVDDSAGVDLRTVQSMDREGFNDKGQVLFSAAFTDGSQGVFVSNLVAIPEPATWVLSVAIGTLIVRHRRCRTQGRVA